MKKESPRRPGCLSSGLRLASWIVLAAVLLLAAGTIHQRIALARTRGQYPAPGRLVEVDGHRMHILCMGSGSPTVVIDAGNGSFSVEWMPIQDELSSVTQICTYDRAGYGWSEAGPQPRDGSRAVSELFELLRAEDVPGPYLLVGHSLGGVHARLFAAEHPAEVAGLILIDTAQPLTISPEYEIQMRSSIGFYQAMKWMTGSGLLRILGPLGGEGSMPETARKLPVELQEVYLSLLLDPMQYSTAIYEMEQLPRTFEQTVEKLAGGLPRPNLPLIVLTAGRTAAPGSTPFDEKTVAVSSRQIESQLELAGLSTRGEQRVIPESGHLVHLDAPGDVIRAVRDLIQIIRAEE